MQETIRWWTVLWLRQRCSGGVGSSVFSRASLVVVVTKGICCRGCLSHLFQCRDMWKHWDIVGNCCYFWGQFTSLIFFPLFLYSSVYVSALALTLVPVFRESDTRGWRHKRCRTAQLPDKPTETLSVSVDIDGSIKETVSEKCWAEECSAMSK